MLRCALDKAAIERAAEAIFNFDEDLTDKCQEETGITFTEPTTRTPIIADVVEREKVCIDCVAWLIADAFGMPPEAPGEPPPPAILL